MRPEDVKSGTGVSSMKGKRKSDGIDYEFYEE